MAEKLDINFAIRYINGESDIHENEEFEKWLQESSVNLELFNDFKKLWLSADKAYENYLPDTSSGWKIVRKNTIDKVRVKSKIVTIAINSMKVAAAILLLVALSFAGKFLYDRSQREEMVNYISSYEKMSVVLSDSTVIWLNANSRLSSPKVFKGQVRTVYLNGEAFFEVTKNPKKPFIVHANNTTTKVLGTSFNLNAHDEDSLIVLTVVTGKVVFSDDRIKEQQLVLLPGQKGKIDLTAGILSMEQNQNTNFLAWKTGKLQFRNASLDEVCNTLKKYYNVKIKIEPLIINKPCSFSGSFDNISLNEATNVIGLTLGIKFINSGDTLFVK